MLMFKYDGSLSAFCSGQCQQADARQCEIAVAQNQVVSIGTGVPSHDRESHHI